MVRLVDEVHDWGALQLVVFTGGEAFLLGRDLVATVAALRKQRAPYAGCH
jgi:hypothetical protein